MSARVIPNKPTALQRSSRSLGTPRGLEGRDATANMRPGRSLNAARFHFTCWPHEEPVGQAAKGVASQSNPASAGGGATAPYVDSKPARAFRGPALQPPLNRMGTSATGDPRARQRPAARPANRATKECGPAAGRGRR
jgi:hypothetical protein